MATWIAHMRVAEKILNTRKDFEVESFLLGNVGPDSGVPNEDWSNFDPPKKITHWQLSEKGIDAEAFFNKYIEDQNKNCSEYYFKLGYYVHLLTDIEWHTIYMEEKKTKLYKDGLDKDKNFIWVIKKDWYGLDYLYLEQHPESLFYKVFQHVKEVPDYLGYFPKGAFTRQVKYITEFYLGENNENKDNFVYLSKEEMDNFVEERSRKIIEKMKIKGL